MESYFREDWKFYRQVNQQKINKSTYINTNNRIYSFWLCILFSFMYTSSKVEIQAFMNISYYTVFRYFFSFFILLFFFEFIYASKTFVVHTYINKLNKLFKSAILGIVSNNFPRNLLEEYCQQKFNHV